MLPALSGFYRSTSSISRIYPFEVLLTLEESGLPQPSKVQAHQIRTIAKQRIDQAVVGMLSEALMQQVDSALKRTYSDRQKRSNRQGA